MTTSIDALTLRRVLGRDHWGPPVLFGPDGWRLVHKHQPSSVIVTCADLEDGTDWVHASMAHDDHTPTYDDLVLLHKAVWPRGGYAFQVFAPPTKHVNIHANALHLWGRKDGLNALPDFGVTGSI